MCSAEASLAGAGKRSGRNGDDLILQYRNKGLGAAVAALIAGAAALAPFRDRVCVQNFRVVESGSIYRGAEQRSRPLQRSISTYGIRTIVCLVDPEPDERSVAASLGVHWVGLPIGDSSPDATFDALESLADILADPSNRPVFFHCRRGVYRSNLGQA